MGDNNMTKKLTVKQIPESIGFRTDEVLEAIHQSDDPSIILDYQQKIKAVREYFKALKQIEKVRVDLLRIEIACIIKLWKLDTQAYGMSKDACKYFIKNGEDVNIYLAKYPDAVTAANIYKAFKKEENAKQAFQDGINAATGSPAPHSFTNESEIKKEANEEYFKTQNAMNILVNDLIANSEAFTITEMTDLFIEKYNGVPTDCRDEYIRGLKWVCRNAIGKIKIDTIGDKKAPRFVTYMDDAHDGESWVHIPFEFANLEQLNQMIELRKEQLSQDSAALNNLECIYEELSGFANNNQNKTIKDILLCVKDVENMVQ